MKKLAKYLAALAAALLLLSPVAARAHCDTLDGPVVKTALGALDAGNVAPVLAWVKPAHEQEIRTAFTKAIEARKRGTASHEASDRRFLETVVRVHRAGEGAGYEGLKSPGEGVGPAVQAADRGIETGNTEEVERTLAAAIQQGLHQRFATVAARFPPGTDVAAGRAWVEAYVEYVHYVEALERTARASGAHGGPAGAAHASHADRPTTNREVSHAHSH